MKRLRTETVVISIFLIASMVFLFWYNMNRKTVLVLHSYATDYSWVRDVNIGINRVLDHKSTYNIRWYYMDTKRHPWPEYKKSAGRAARAFIERMQPDVVIAIDDDAQAHVARHFIDHPKIKVVFAGVNNQAADYGYDKANNVTGVLERLPLHAAREMLQMSDTFKNLGRPLRIAFLGDDSGTVKGDARQVQNFDWSPARLSDTILAESYPQWQAAVESLSRQADIIMVTNYRGLRRSDTDTSLVPATEVIAWTEANAKVPVFSGNGFFTEDGGMLAIGTSPYQQGSAAAEMALQMISGEKTIDQIPIISSKQFVVSMNASKMQARSFKLPQVYEAAARTGDKYIP